MLTHATAEQGREVTRHVPWRGVERAGGLQLRASRSGTGVRAGRAERVARRKPRPHPAQGGPGRWSAIPRGWNTRSRKVAVQRLAADVFDDLPERRKPVVGVRPERPRLDFQTQTAPVILRQGRHGLSQVGSFRRSQSLLTCRDAARGHSGIPAVWVSRCRTVAGRQLALSGQSR